MYYNPYPFYVFPPAMPAGRTSDAPSAVENKYSEELIKKSVGKSITAYMTYDSSDQWRSKIFSGTLLESGRDYFLMRDKSSGKDLVLLSINLNYMLIDNEVKK